MLSKHIRKFGKYNVRIKGKTIAVIVIACSHISSTKRRKSGWVVRSLCDNSIFFVKSAMRFRPFNGIIMKVKNNEINGGFSRNIYNTKN